MQPAYALFAAAALAAIVPAPAQAGQHGPSGASGSAAASAGSTPSGGTSIREPSDAVLVLMGAAGVVIGRKLHARARRKDD